jgi:ABC-type antimicrobial peptide transport system permease subunit
VIGVSADANSESLELAPTGAYYLPIGQSDGLNQDRTLFLRTAGDPEGMITSVRRQLLEMEPDLPFTNIRLLADQIDPLIRPWRLGAILFGVMAAIALLVALVGLYSVLSYTVAQRSREFGIRTALGARVRDVAALVVAEGQRVMVLAVSLGILVVVLVGGWLSPFLFKTSPRDPIVLATVAALLVLAAFLGSLLPARRAARVEPMQALRSE